MRNTLYICRGGIDSEPTFSKLLASLVTLVRVTGTMPNVAEDYCPYPSPSGPGTIATQWFVGFLYSDIRKALAHRKWPLHVRFRGRCLQVSRRLTVHSISLAAGNSSPPLATNGTYSEDVADT